MRYLILSLVLITSLATACGSSDSPPTGLCAENGVTTDIVDNHPSGSHTLAVPVAEHSRNKGPLSATPHAT